jgi:hypothetical protein
MDPTHPNTLIFDHHRIYANKNILMFNLYRARLCIDVVSLHTGGLDLEDDR